MRSPRCETLDPNQVLLAHVSNQTAQRCFLMGTDPVDGKNFDHRQSWIEEIIRHFAGCFGIDLISFSILPDQFHLILRSRPDIVATWDDREVARRWLLICPARRSPEGEPISPTEDEISALIGCAGKFMPIRQQLSDIAWWVRLLSQRVATRSNREDSQDGHFFRHRYKSSLLADEAALLACSVFVDLQVVRAALAETIQTSDHTSAQLRSDDLDYQPTRQSIRPLKPSDFISPVEIDNTVASPGQLKPNNRCCSVPSSRCSDDGFLAMSSETYLELLNWVAAQPDDDPVPRELVNGSKDRENETDQGPAACLAELRRVGLSPDAFLELSRDFGKLFTIVAGKCGCIDGMRTRRTSRPFYLRRRARELMRSEYSALTLEFDGV